MKVLTVVTSTRAEYGILSSLIKKFMALKKYEVRVVVTGAHLSEEYGYTYREIVYDGIPVDDKIEILERGNSSLDISKTMGNALHRFADYFAKRKPDALLVLGDRYEILAVCLAAMNERIPIIHLHGGETTEGAIDEGIRHAITKLSYLHFTSTEVYRRRVIQMGEEPSRVYNVGALGVENALKLELFNKNELFEALDLDLYKKYAIVTFHPVTLEDKSAEEQCKSLLEAMDMHRDMVYIITKANADANGRIINKIMDEYAKKRNNVYVIDSMGVRKYLSALKYAEMVIGNSSSGILEAPSFGIPTINIGDRQRGRIQSDSVINCNTDSYEICKAIEKAKSLEFKDKCKLTINPYEGGDTTEKIIDAVNKMFGSDIDLKKHFFDIDY